mmetsp:Transcript_2281/g.5208  ORF Transcript_2281/g.5208 Transcript_2281/m.5208 type:complete len:613 (+) Transcript_2281:764-2602(+)
MRPDGQPPRLRARRRQRPGRRPRLLRELRHVQELRPRRRQGPAPQTRRVRRRADRHHHHAQAEEPLLLPRPDGARRHLQDLARVRGGRRLGRHRQVLRHDPSRELDLRPEDRVPLRRLRVRRPLPVPDPGDRDRGRDGRDHHEGPRGGVEVLPAEEDQEPRPHRRDGVPLPGHGREGGRPRGGADAADLHPLREGEPLEPPRAEARPRGDGDGRLRAPGEPEVRLGGQDARVPGVLQVHRRVFRQRNDRPLHRRKGDGGRLRGDEDPRHPDALAEPAGGELAPPDPPGGDPPHPHGGPRQPVEDAREQADHAVRRQRPAGRHRADRRGPRLLRAGQAGAAHGHLPQGDATRDLRAGHRPDPVRPDPIALHGGRPLRQHGPAAVDRPEQPARAADPAGLQRPALLPAAHPHVRRRVEGRQDEPLPLHRPQERGPHPLHGGPRQRVPVGRQEAFPRPQRGAALGGPDLRPAGGDGDLPPHVALVRVPGPVPHDSDQLRVARRRLLVLERAVPGRHRGDHERKPPDRDPGAPGRPLQHHHTAAPVHAEADVLPPHHQPHHRLRVRQQDPPPRREEGAPEGGSGGVEEGRRRQAPQDRGGEGEDGGRGRGRGRRGR